MACGSSFDALLYCMHTISKEFGSSFRPRHSDQPAFPGVYVPCSWHGALSRAAFQRQPHTQGAPRPSAVTAVPGMACTKVASLSSCNTNIQILYFFPSETTVKISIVRALEALKVAEPCSVQCSSLDRFLRCVRVSHAPRGGEHCCPESNS